MNNTFELISDLKIGHIVEVSGTTIRVELSGDVTELTRTHEGRVYPIGQIGSIVKVHFGRRLVFGFVTLLRMRSEEMVEQVKPIAPDADQRLMEVELFAEGIWNSTERNLHFIRGVTTYPLPRQTVHLLTREEASEIYSAAEGQQRGADYDPLVPFAHYVGADNGVGSRRLKPTFHVEKHVRKRHLHNLARVPTGWGKASKPCAELMPIQRESNRFI